MTRTLKLPRIFVTLAVPTLQAAENLVTKLALPHVGYELRLDYLRDISEVETQLRPLLTALRFPPVIATCRRARAGGLFRGTVSEQIAILKSAAQSGCQWVDLEWDSLDRSGGGAIDEFGPAKVIVSHHNYRQTPPLAPLYRRLARSHAQVVKIATHARHLRDNVKIYSLLKAHHPRKPKLVAFGLGPSGIPSRLLALRWGSAFTYASAGSSMAVAAGQLPVEVVRAVYRADRLDRRSLLFGVVGSRASISLSPAMQNMAFQAKRVNAVYLPCETPRFRDFVAFARALGFAGFSVTMPFKRAVMRELDWVDPLAMRIGACNTVAVQHGRWMGWNTDAAAIIEVVSKRLRLAGSVILILGSGGAARAAAYALRTEGVNVLIAARREAAAKRLARAVSAQIVPWDSVDGLEVDAVVNATPVGMAPHPQSSPLDLSRLRARVVFDMVYHPLETRFLADARGRGMITISGIEMLVAQGARQFEIWTGLAAPRALMEQAARHALSQSSSHS